MPMAFSRLSPRHDAQVHQQNEPSTGSCCSSGNLQAPAPSNQPHRCLQTPELLELMLLQVDMHTLLVYCQRVCHSWKSSIDNSRALQRKLYFLPDFSIAPRTRWHDRYLPDTTDLDLSEAQRQCRGIQNELLKRPRCFYRWFQCGLKFYLPNYHNQVVPPSFLEMSKRYVHPNSSWRRMLVQNRPPITKLASWTVVSIYQARREGVEVQVWSCPPGDGLRMGQFYGWGFRHGYKDSADPSRGSLWLYWATASDLFLKAVSTDGRGAVVGSSDKLELKRRVADTAGIVMFRSMNHVPSVNEREPSETGGFWNAPECWKDEVDLVETGRWRVGDDVWEHRSSEV